MSHTFSNKKPQLVRYGTALDFIQLEAGLVSIM